ncbi:DUF420 domain-containing protein [Leeuwenhoekiella marinoflava]|uniref:Membrane protein n=2 Tax=Leeuwenhoekiella marinoflava TaxID=988 RepID=A0ABY1HQI7_9FLAO|nr:DUF420 domain-containing protein [Leeuwenhoekiella marinoflava]RXG31657.1 putative membrane protein [Leeuwenhoekiella marinoflava]SHF09596.1 putative membrane protein [Leeuwenhoekiella marinoflava DSM 3653]
MENIAQKEKLYNRWIIALSIAIPVAVAFLFTIRIPGVERLGFLPPIYATINALTAVLLFTAVIQIKKGNRDLHEKLMKVCLGLSLIFLVLYVIYHATSDSTKFGDANLDGVVSDAESAAVGVFKYVYYFILITHILLSIGVIPFVLVTYVRAVLGKFPLHRKIARITFPIWLYVAVTGVVVYFMIFPYYPA